MANEPSKTPIPAMAQTIPLSKIHDLPGIFIGKPQDKTLGGLVSSIQSGGVKDPVILRALDNGEYQLVSGYRRRRASELAKLTDIPAFVYEMTLQEAQKYRKIANTPKASESIPGKLIEPVKGKDAEKQAEAVKPDAPDRSGKDAEKPTEGKDAEKQAEAAKPDAPDKDGKDAEKPAEGKDAEKRAEAVKPDAPDKDGKEAEKPAEGKDAEKQAEAAKTDAPNKDGKEAVKPAEDKSAEKSGKEDKPAEKQGEAEHKPTVAELEAQAKAGKPVNISDIIDAQQREREAKRAAEAEKGKDKLKGTLRPSDAEAKRMEKATEKKAPAAEKAADAPAQARAAEGPAGTAISQIFDKRLDPPDEAAIKALPVPKEGESFFITLHPAYLKKSEFNTFSVDTESENFKELLKSVELVGIKDPVLARFGKDGALEILSGQRRHLAAQMLNQAVPTIIQKIDDADAKIIVADGNLHRDKISSYDLSRALRMKMEGMKQKAGRRKKGYSAEELHSDVKLAQEMGMSVRFRNLMTASVQYTLLRRCGLNPGDYLDDDDLAGITEFTTPAVLHHLGEAVSSVSKDLLMEIGRSIRAFEQEARKSRENNLEKPLANQAVIGYTEVTRNFNTLNHESAERSDTHEQDEHDGADVHEGRGLSDSRSGDGQRGRSGGDASGQVWDAAGELPEAGASRDVHLDAADGAVGAAPAGDRPAGAGAGGQDRERPDEARRRERGAESQRSDGVGAGGQQLHGAGRGNGADGDRLQVTTEQAEHEAAGEEPAASLSMEPDAPDAEKPAAPPRFSLFPTVEEQVEAITEAQAEERRAAAEEPAQLRLDGADRIPDAVIGRALTAGSNERGSIKRIVAHFQKDYPIANSAAFLKEEFGTGGKGVTIAGQKYALWYDGDGVHIAAGNRALTPNDTTISWTDAALLISDLLRKGMYATQENIDGARGNEFEELAQKLAYMRQDFSEEAREHGFLPSIESAFSGNVYPEITLQITELLRKPESRAAIVSELRQFADSYALNGDLLRFRRIHDPETLWARLFALDKPIAEFHAVEAFEPVRASFITEDEIDELLKRSGANRIDDGKLGLFSYILQGHNAKECADYMRRQYGDGGFGRMGYDEWHDSKGIRYRRGDDASGFSGYDTVSMNWNQVYKRVRQLIDDGRYLNEKEQGYLHAYEMKMLARNIYVFQYYTDLSTAFHSVIKATAESIAAPTRVRSLRLDRFIKTFSFQWRAKTP